MGMKAVALLTVMPVTALIAGCALFGIRHKIDFSPLERANRLVVLTRSGDIVKTINDAAQVNAAARFIQAYRSGWQDPFRGPVVPDFVLHFYAGSRGLGGYGIGPGVLTSDPPTAGFWSRPAPPDDVNRLASMLGLRLGDN
jgi:hypothetical protein